MGSSEPMIRLEGITKVFDVQSGPVHALTDVSLEVMPGDIQGIIGFSGAGKSTLVRCINLLERPDSGKVFVDGCDLMELNEKELRKMRKKIGMIFQLFNLMRSRTIYSNVAFPLKGSGLSSKEKHDKVMSLLKIVGLENRADAYPAQLSGGQKQRVAIARALASDPDVLLCDEATSALDPQTTQDILALLKDLNRRLGITVVVITHEMAVVKEICNKVAVMEEGRIVEKGDIYTVFSDPQMPITKRFLGTSKGLNEIKEQMLANPETFGLEKGDTVTQLVFKDQSASHAFVSSVSRQFDIDVSIIYGNIELLVGKPMGQLVTIMKGSKENIENAIRYMTENDVSVEVIHHA